MPRHAGDVDLGGAFPEGEDAVLLDPSIGTELRLEVRQDAPDGVEVALRVAHFRLVLVSVLAVVVPPLADALGIPLAAAEEPGRAALGRPVVARNEEGAEPEREDVVLALLPLHGARLVGTADLVGRRLAVRAPAPGALDRVLVADGLPLAVVVVDGGVLSVERLELLQRGGRLLQLGPGGGDVVALADHGHHAEDHARQRDDDRDDDQHLQQGERAAPRRRRSGGAAGGRVRCGSGGHRASLPTSSR